ncbi:hypothetical protein FRC09_000585 [Ceratobasidium sp. 395]|nr:hypothetical protein FRC09_000585 [Ceratobasidium sp. 395]
MSSAVTSSKKTRTVRFDIPSSADAAVVALTPAPAPGPSHETMTGSRKRGADHLSAAQGPAKSSKKPTPDPKSIECDDDTEEEAALAQRLGNWSKDLADGTAVITNGTVQRKEFS